jgi:methylated-DNA-[protein]-cysteine S-methyltransferase
MIDETRYAIFESPVGKIEIRAVDKGIVSILFKDDDNHPKNPTPSPHIENLLRQLSEYFKGKRKEFDIALVIEGTEFQQKVWKELMDIPYGKTISYSTLAENLGDEKTIRAAASANGKNRHALVIPCHRVIGADGSLTGYAGGLWRKKWLLAFEKRAIGETVQGELF